MSLKFTLEKTPKGHILCLTGDIDENADFEQIPPPEKGAFIIDLSGIFMLNSVGLRSWLQWVRSFKGHPSLFLQKCPARVVHQMSILEGFLPLSATVLSLEVPFACEKCEHHFSYWAERGRDYTEAVGPSPGKVLMSLQRPCEKCGAVAEADIFPSRHFLFLRAR